MSKVRQKRWYEALSSVSGREWRSQQSRINELVNASRGAVFSLTQPENLAAVVGYLAAGRGLRLWRSVDLSCVRNDMLTPGDAGKPHWAYENAGELEPSKIWIEHRGAVEIPAEWYPLCHKCGGCKVRTVQEMAAIWKISEEAALEQMLAPSWTWGPVTNGTFNCNYCDGSGYIREPFVVFARQERFGIAFKGMVNAIKMCYRLQQHYAFELTVDWDWAWYDTNAVAVTFFTHRGESLASYLTSQEVPCGDGG